MPRGRAPTKPPRPEGDKSLFLHQIGGAWAEVEAQRRAWHATGKAVDYVVDEDDQASSTARRAARAEAKAVQEEAKLAAAAAEADAAEDTADAPEARPPSKTKIALFEALNNRLEAALLKQKRETKA